MFSFVFFTTFAVKQNLYLPQKAGKHNPVIFQMDEQKRLQKIVSDSAGNKTQGPNHMSDLHEMYSNQEKMYFLKVFWTAAE